MLLVIKLPYTRNANFAIIFNCYFHNQLTAMRVEYLMCSGVSVRKAEPSVRGTEWLVAFLNICYQKAFNK